MPCVSILPADDQPDTVFFGNFLLRKSIKNLQQDAWVGILVITPELRGWMLTGDFVEFQRTGAYVDRQMSSSLLRYNAYTGVRNAGVIRVRLVDGSFAISKLQMVKDYALARLAALVSHEDGGTVMPLAVRREFARMVAVKVLAWIRFEAISYQAKGRWSARGRTGAIAVQQVYAGGPPYPGGRVV